MGECWNHGAGHVQCFIGPSRARAATQLLGAVQWSISPAFSIAGEPEHVAEVVTAMGLGLRCAYVCHA